VTPDTSVVVAGFAEWHPDFKRAHDALRADFAIAAHVALETYSTLTRLPDPFRATPEIAAEYIDAGFVTERLTLPNQEHDRMVSNLAVGGVWGGATYDALIALTAAHHGLTLLTLDRRAEITYRRLGIAYQLLQSNATS
jgi:predicted nucleic acid-binding protein